MGEKRKPIEFSIRAYRPGDEVKLVDFLNLCYSGEWGDMKWWQWLYPSCPSFERDSIFIIEGDNQIIGHRSLHPRNLIVCGKKVPIIFLGSTAIHPDYRGFGLYSRLHQATLEATKSKGVSLALTLNSRGSITHNNNKRTGFMEINRGPTYLKPINYETFFKAQVSSFISRRENLKDLLRDLGTRLYLSFGETEFSLEELLDGDSSTPLAEGKKGEVKVTLSKTSLPPLVDFMVGGKLQKLKSLSYLLFTGRVRVRFSSPIALARATRVGIGMLRYV